jgi:hypothetical protein
MEEAGLEGVWETVEPEELLELDGLEDDCEPDFWEG